MTSLLKIFKKNDSTAQSTTQSTTQIALKAIVTTPKNEFAPNEELTSDLKNKNLELAAANRALLNEILKIKNKMTGLRAELKIVRRPKVTISLKSLTTAQDENISLAQSYQMSSFILKRKFLASYQKINASFTDESSPLITELSNFIVKEATLSELRASCIKLMQLQLLSKKTLRLIHEAVKKFDSED
jgi:hypothetical protein